MASELDVRLGGVVKGQPDDDHVGSLLVRAAGAARAANDDRRIGGAAGALRRRCTPAVSRIDSSVRVVIGSQGDRQIPPRVGLLDAANDDGLAPLSIDR